MTEEQRQAWKVKKEAKRKETDAKLQKILTKEQFQQYETERASRMKQKENYKKNKNQ